MAQKKNLDFFLEDQMMCNLMMYNYQFSLFFLLEEILDIDLMVYILFVHFEMIFVLIGNFEEGYFEYLEFYFGDFLDFL